MVIYKEVEVSGIFLHFGSHQRQTVQRNEQNM